MLDRYGRILNHKDHIFNNQQIAVPNGIISEIYLFTQEKSPFHDRFPFSFYTF